jgi:very-short-patch-repair endonuclease
MPPELVRRGELRPGVPLLREVADVETEVQRLSRQGWIAVFWPQAVPPSEAVDLLLLAVGKAAQRHAVEHEPHWTPDAWSRAAKFLLSEGQVPIPAAFGRELTLHRLIRWLAPDTRDLVMGVAGPVAELRAFETLGEWFSRAAEAGCLILLPSRQKINSRVNLTFRSEAERLLYQAMSRDGDLRGLFEPNVRVITRFQTAPCVDFLWREGKIVVEVDSYFTHGGKNEFASDRQRDYETLVSGYLTVRLLYEEVLRDCQLALNKVRRVVALRTEQHL